MKARKITQNKAKVYIIIGILLTLFSCFVAGCIKKGQQNSSTSSFHQMTSDSALDIGLEEAKKIALEHAKLQTNKITFVKEILNRDNSVIVYEFEFVSDTVKYDCEIKAGDGSILQFSQRPIVQIPGNISTQGLISIAIAKEAALTHAELTTEQIAYTKVELKDEGNTAQYEIEFYSSGLKYDYTIHAVTGAVIEAKTETYD